jgi:hypothetical protein
MYEVNMNIPERDIEEDSKCLLMDNDDDYDEMTADEYYLDYFNRVHG